MGWGFQPPDVNWVKHTAPSISSSEFLVALREFSLRQIVFEPTQKAYILDLICVPVGVFCGTLTVISLLSSRNDHSGVETVITVSGQRISAVKRQKWVITSENTLGFRSALHETNWGQVLGKRTSSEQAELFEKQLLSVAEQCLEMKILTHKQGCVNYSFAIKRVIKQRNPAYRAFLRAKSHKLRQQLRLRWNKKSRKAEILVGRSDRQRVTEAAKTAPGNPRKFWHFVRQTVNWNPTALLRTESVAVASANCEESKCLINYFASVQLPCLTHCTEKQISPDSEVSAEFHINETDIWKSLTKLSARTSSDPYTVTIPLLKPAGSAILYPLKIIFQQIMKSESFPEMWKKILLIAFPETRN